MAHIRLENITKKFGSHTALRNLNLEIADGVRSSRWVICRTPATRRTS